MAPHERAPADEGGGSVSLAAGRDDTEGRPGPSQPSLEDALAAARGNTYTPHRELVVDAIEGLASERVLFTSDDVMDRAGLEQPLGSVGSLGALMNVAATRGTIEHVGFARSRRPSRHRAWIQTWRGAA